MKDKQSWSKSPLSVFRHKLSYKDFLENIRRLVPNLNQNASAQKLSEMYERYIANFDKIEKTSASRIKLSTIGFFSSTNTNIKYWLDRGWSEEQALLKIKNRQSICTPDIAKKIQETLDEGELISHPKSKQHEGKNPLCLNTSLPKPLG